MIRVTAFRIMDESLVSLCKLCRPWVNYQCGDEKEGEVDKVDEAFSLSSYINSPAVHCFHLNKLHPPLPTLF